MKVNVRTANGRCFAVFVNDSASVEDLKKSIEQSENISFDEIRLVFDDKLLTNGKITSYGIRENHTINMVITERVSIRVSLKLPDGKRCSMELAPSEQIIDVKKKIERSYNFTVDQIELIFEGRTIEDGRLTHHHIRDGATLEIKLKKIRITVSDMNGKKFDIEISHGETVEGLKQRLHKETGVVASQQRLLCSGRELSTGTLTSYGICNGSLINMVGRLRGG